MQRIYYKKKSVWKYNDNISLEVDVGNASAFPTLLSSALGIQNMKKFSLLIEQIAQCKDFILSGAVADLRMALILLDNTAELMMYRTILGDLLYDGWYAKIHEKANKELDQKTYKKFLNEVNIPIPLSLSKKRKILRYFNEKLKFLVNKDRIDIHLSSVLSSLHNFRNETFHRDLIRHEILLDLTILFFDVVCEMALKLNIGPTTYASDENWEYFFSRFNIERANVFISEDNVEKLISSMKKEIKIDIAKLKDSFVSYLTNRYSESRKNLDFVMRCIGINEEEFVFNKLKSMPFESDDLEFNKLKYDVYHSIEPQISILSDCKDKYTLFSEFMKIEELFAPIEKIINEAAFEFDSAIELQAEIARGK